MCQPVAADLKLYLVVIRQVSNLRLVCGPQRVEWWSVVRFLNRTYQWDVINLEIKHHVTIILL